MRRFITALLLTAIVGFTSCADGDPDCDLINHTSTIPVNTVKSYKIVIHKDVSSERVGLILNAAFEWVTVSSGAVVFEVVYEDFDMRAEPRKGEMRVYTESKVDKTSKTIGVCNTWGKDDHGRPARSRIWIQDDLTPQTYYLTAMHEIGHGLGLSHQEDQAIPSIMYPLITDVGDHPTCDDRKRLCVLWECEPGC